MPSVAHLEAFHARELSATLGIRNARHRWLRGSVFASFPTSGEQRLGAIFNFVALQPLSQSMTT